MDWRVEDLSLPSEIWGDILKRLGTQDIIRASRVNKISLTCRLFVRILSYTEDWPLFGQRIASLPNIVKIDIANVNDLHEFEKLTVLQKLQDLSLSGQSNRPLLYNVLEKIPSLRALNMTYFPGNFDLIADSCTQITQLILRSARNDTITHITSIQKLTQLRMLKLVIERHVPPVDLDGLTHLKNLTQLVLQGSNFNINVARGDLTALTNLKTLLLKRVIVNNLCDGIAKLTNLENLRVMQLGGSRTNSVFEECLGLTRLTSLDVDALSMKGNLHRMNELTQLKALQVDMLPDTLDHLTKLTNLKKLALGGSVPHGFLSNLLPNMVQLENLHIWTWKERNVNDEELNYFSSLDRLTSLSLYSLDSITSAGVYHALHRLTNLTFLDISGKRLLASELVDLISLPHIKTVFICGAVEKR
jgi:hypothetical protein